MTAPRHINGRVLVAVVLAFVLLVVAGLYAIAPLKVFFVGGEVVLARGQWTAGNTAPTSGGGSMVWMD